MEGCKSVALDSLRKGAGGIIGVGFVLVLIASFIIWFPAGWFQGYGTQDIITVGGVKIDPKLDVFNALNSDDYFSVRTTTYSPTATAGVSGGTYMQPGSILQGRLLRIAAVVTW